MQSPISLFHIVNDHLATGAQPSATDFSWLKSQGYTAIVNLNTPSTKSYLPEESFIVTDLGMKYVAHPLDCSVLSPQLYQGFEDIMRSLEGEHVFVHCAGNVKSSGMVHIYRVNVLGEDPHAALADLASIGAEHEPKWMEFFKQMHAA